MKRRFLHITMLALVALQLRAATIATFQTSVGNWEVELFDDKPITVSNFIKYAASGRYDDQIIHRWVPGFVLQGGGYTLKPTGGDSCSIENVANFGTIPNESKVGAFRSNVYGTIAMARVGSDVNSASSQWYINLADNGGEPPNGLDYFAEGYTVFGRVISGTNIINRFVPPPPTNGIYIHQTAIGPIAVLTNSANLTCGAIITMDLSFRRDMNLQMTANFRGIRQLAWDSVGGVTNSIDYSANLASWVTYTNLIGTGQRMSLAEPANEPHRFYRVRLLY
jgi:cyclophilin family peptidyl-prolyl cis-trans isomerase